MVGALIAAGAEVDARDQSSGRTALMWACYEGRLEPVNALIEAGADASTPATDDAAWEPIHFAAFRGHRGVIEALIGANASTAATTSAGESPFDLAILNLKPLAAHLLLGVPP